MAEESGGRVSASGCDHVVCGITGNNGLCCVRSFDHHLVWPHWCQLLGDSVCFLKLLVTGNCLIPGEFAEQRQSPEFRFMVSDPASQLLWGLRGVVGDLGFQFWMWCPVVDHCVSCRNECVPDEGVRRHAAGKRDC